MENKDLMVLVALHDKVSGTFGFPVCFENINVAGRSFIDLVKRNDQIKNHPGDFVFYHIGYYNPKTGEIYSQFTEDKDIIMTGLEAVAKGGEE